MSVTDDTSKLKTGGERDGMKIMTAMTARTTETDKTDKKKSLQTAMFQVLSPRLIECRSKRGARTAGGVIFNPGPPSRPRLPSVSSRQPPPARHLEGRIQ